MVADFLNAMALHMPDDARLMACQFRGDPNAEFPGKWRSFPLTSIKQLDNQANIYLTVSAMGRNARGEFRRRKENFAGGLLLMIDDLGDGPASKFPLSTVKQLVPTCLIETSPGNHQAVYMFDRLVTDMALFERLIKGFIAKQFLGKDTGMAGINRVFRPPAGINGKPKHNGWHVRSVQENYALRYSPEQIALAFEIDLTPRPINRAPRGATEDKADLIRAFVDVRTFLRSAGMIKTEPNLAGWQDVVCPWTDGHTGAVDNGAAIKEPDEENGWHGAWKCHHGSCEGKGWRELTEWVGENQAEILELINGSAATFESYKEK